MRGLEENLWVASARSHIYDRDDGGAWVSTDQGSTWTRTLRQPVFNLLSVPSSKTESKAGSKTDGEVRRPRYSLLL